MASHPLVDHPAAKDWLHRLYSRGDSDGSQLVIALGTPRDGRPGLSDNCYLADRILDALVDAKWIEPVAYRPSREQRFFGVGGRAPGKTPRKATGWRAGHTYPQEFAYRANLKSAEFMAWLGVGSSHL